MASPSTQLWKEAYDELSQKIKDSLPKDPPDSILDLQHLAQQKVEEARRGRLKVKIKDGKNLVLRDAFEKMAHWIARFVQVGDTVVQYDPGHAALPWAAVRFILTTSIANVERHAAVHEGVEEILRLLYWSRLQEQLYLGFSIAAEDRLRQSLRSFYQQILAFLAKACRFQGQGHLHHAVGSVLSSGGDKYQRRRQAIEDAAASIKEITDQIAREGQIESQIQTSANWQDCSLLLRGIELPIRRNENNQKEALQILNANERDKALDWTSNIPYQYHYTRARKKALDGTGRWLLSHSNFLQWKESSCSEILWLHGMPGSGKSTLLSILLRDLIQEHESYSCSFPTYFYCARSTAEQERSDPEQVMRCLLRQLASPQDACSIHPALKDRYEKRSTAGPITLDEATNLVAQIVDDRVMTYIIVDALDECNRDNRHDLLIAFMKLLQQAAGLLKIFVTSRDDQDLVSIMNTYPEIRISAADNKADISHYVVHSVEDLISKKRLLPTQGISSDLKAKIVRSLQDGAQGMFRWVELQLQFLCQFTIPSKLEKRLGNLPKQLRDIYQDLYEYNVKIHEQEEIEVMNAIFSWLIVCERRLRSQELISLVCQQTHTEDALTVKSVLMLSFNFVQYDEKQDTFSFTHLSVREFLEEGPEIFQSVVANDSATLTCLQILQHTNKYNEEGLDYARWFWAYHASRVNCERAKSTPELDSFLCQDSSAFVAWGESIKSSSNLLDVFSIGTEEQKRMASTFTPHPNPLFVACEWDLQRQARTLILQSEWHTLVSVHNYYFQNALYIAAHNGFMSIVKMLLDRGADVNAQGGVALQIASSDGHLELAEMLINKGADVNAQSEWGSALKAALEEGHVEIAQMLINRGAKEEPGWLCPRANSVQPTSNTISKAELSK